MVLLKAYIVESSVLSFRSKHKNYLAIGYFICKPIILRKAVVFLDG